MNDWNWRKFAKQRGHTLIMGILNVTPDSFFDGGKNLRIDDAVKHAEKMAGDGADIIDIGGESTRPDSKKISVAEEIDRVIPVIKAIKAAVDIPISIDTYKSEVAKAALDAGALIVNDISGLKFDRNISNIVADANAGLILMHLRGEFETMHSQDAVEDIFCEVVDSLSNSIDVATRSGVERSAIALDIGIGFSKTFEQNLALIADLDKINKEFTDLPIVVGVSRKSFLGKLLNGAKPEDRLFGSIAANVLAVKNGASIVRVHDVKQTRDALTVTEAIMEQI